MDISLKDVLLGSQKTLKFKESIGNGLKGEFGLGPLGKKSVNYG
tara:strand:- start:56734 stop:56865 length:132 start_codon:yes stop_codon:yes gene_type:complete